MKFFEKMMALLLSLAAVLSFAMPAFAEDGLAPTAAGTHTITISFEKPGHEYVAYQVFKGDYYKAESDGKEHLSNIEWGNGVNGADLLKGLQSEKGFKEDFKNAKTAADVAYILEGYGNNDNSDKLDAFAKVVAKHLSAVDAGTSKSEEDAVNGKYKYSISVTGDGYYFVQDKNVVTGKDDANTKYILRVLGDVQINAKADVPDIEKKITDAKGDNPRKGDSYNVGDTVYFELTSKVPDMDGYDSYTYKVTDTLSDGLTLVTDENGTPQVTVTIGGEKYEKFTATLNKNTLTIDFSDFIAQKENKGDKKNVIRYAAVLNEKALQKDKENNSVYLEYSNNPNGIGTGKTTEKKTYVYNFDIDIVKHETGDNNKLLSGAEFVLYRLNSQEEKEYYNYTDKKETEWKKLDNDKLETIRDAVDKRTITSKTTTANGKTSFTGLKAGTYYLQEIKAPDGYNLPADAEATTTVEIEPVYNEDGTIDSDKSNVTVKGTDHMYVTADIANKPGPVLPSTGGIGTTIFYVLGGILTVAAIVLLIVKKRMENTKR